MRHDINHRQLLAVHHKSGQLMTCLVALVNACMASMCWPQIMWTYARRWGELLLLPGRTISRQNDSI
jgi:hypothetical protein